MKKSIFFMALFLIVTVAGAIAKPVAPVQDVNVHGKATWGCSGQAVQEGLVTITCTHNGVDFVVTDATSNGGSYSTKVDGAKCTEGDTVTVRIDKDGQSASASGVVDNKYEAKIDVEVPCQEIPEFGVGAGALAVSGAGLGIMLLRKRA